MQVTSEKRKFKRKILHMSGVLGKIFNCCIIAFSFFVQTLYGRLCIGICQIFQKVVIELFVYFGCFNFKIM